MGRPDQRRPARTTHVHYAEARGEGATETLRALLAELPGQPGFLGAELLLSPPQPGLALLASRWSQEPALTLPPGVRAWAFVVVDAV